MAEAFTAGVKPGGLTNETEIRILLCYLVKWAQPLTRDAMQGALLEEQLVNYFEFVDALNELQEQQFIEATDKGFVITDKGSVVAKTLSDDLPRSVRESAIRAVIRIQSWVHKAAQNKARIEKKGNEYRVICTIEDMGRESFQLQLDMPNRLTAEMVKNRFIAQGSEVYSQLLNLLTQPDPKSTPPEAVL
ncbi:DUF4364 family protein [uncultured Gemmiger sp.]|uniref:DUF4364 family protein n=1 Tax=uncultured Gemmiger sp. TaxID=1623490 RepID=UPI0025DF1FB4|nr:DUF4364 family protein [uncultured Gemmiger sp.]